MARWTLAALACCIAAAAGSWYEASEVDWNLNDNINAAGPLQYTIPEWSNHTYQSSPKNWRMPFYSFFLDRWVNGEPGNDNANGTAWEHDPTGTQLRHGGDAQGLIDSLDYLHGLGIRAIYIAGGLLMNLPWEYDMYSPVDRTLLDHHFGTIDELRKMVEAVHDRGMYIIIDNTMSTMSNLFGFSDYLNTSAPWSFTEHDMEYTTDRHYRDFTHSNVWEPECSVAYPKFWNQRGVLINDSATASMVGCRDSDFDQYGSVTAFGSYKEWRMQLSKFAGVQDRLREWKPSVMDKLVHFSCLMVHGLDIDGFRIDKGVQVTVDAQGEWSHRIRECAHKVGKKNFFIPGEIVNGNVDGSIYLGRGKQPDMEVKNITKAGLVNSRTANASDYLRPVGHNALDAAAFHYSTYRALLRYLGLNGDFSAVDDAPVNFQEQWSTLMQTNDMGNAYTGDFDPRHMYGASNQDVFRWPSLAKGTQRQLLAHFITTMLMPGIPLINWGEEQAFYTLDNTATNYIFGRQAMTSSKAWQMHGCHKLGDENIYEAPWDASRTACEDDSVSLDHRDPSAPVHGVLKEMFEMRARYPVLNDGFVVSQLSNMTYEYVLSASRGVATQVGLWSVVRGRQVGAQDLSDDGIHGNQHVWLLHSNINETTVYQGNCSSMNESIISPFAAGVTVKNMFYPFDEWTVQNLSIASTEDKPAHPLPNGCISSMNMTEFGWKAFVPKDVWMEPSPLITKFLPGHDARLLSNTSADEPTSVDVEVRFSREMNCTSLKESLSISSRTAVDDQQASIDTAKITCESINPQFEADFYGPSPSIWRAKIPLTNVYDGIHQLAVKNVSDRTQSAYTHSNDQFMIRIGQADNPMVFPATGNYSTEFLFSDSISKRDVEVTDSHFYVNHKAAGADKWRYSMSFGGVWSDWIPYVPGNASLAKQVWTGTEKQKWDGDHVSVQYWSKFAGSSDHIMEGDLFNDSRPIRRFPHLFVHGDFNEYGFDAGIPNKMDQLDNGTWKFDFMYEWPTQFQLNVWGMDPNGQPDLTQALGDIDNDTVLDRISPVSLQAAVTNITNLGPGSPHLAWRILFNDGDLRYYLVPVGNRWAQLALWLLFAIVPVTTAILAVWLYMRFFAVVKFNEIGLSEKRRTMTAAFLEAFAGKRHDEKSEIPDLAGVPYQGLSSRPVSQIDVSRPVSQIDVSRPVSQINPSGPVSQNDMTVAALSAPKRRTVLIATIEYDILDWNIKIKIGGLGVMAQLMGKHLDHQDLVWVVPCVGGVDYPVDTPVQQIDVKILGKIYEVQVQIHKLNNITYVLLDAPIFRGQTQKEPYPARMDDLDSAIYYSAWNQCIAEVMRRFPIDLYHINDYHGTLAPLYLLPKMVPCCLSLHNAEFQGLWPMRTSKEVAEVCSVFNLPETIVMGYVQFGEVFNLLHAGASILRIHQKGHGAVGVSKKYGKRSWARYPIFWGLRNIGALPNPDPSDFAEWDKKITDPKSVAIDQSFEDSRGSLRIQAQQWAGLEQDAEADLLVFVGRWSMQKGIDLIADVFPGILDRFPKTQLICIGPTIDLHGKFAALKLDVMMQKYPGRVYSKPEFTALPPFIFSGAEFALIPSRDEPFGLVAVEFGRKGALGIGARVGGLGQMPGWWYTVESTTTKHLMHQFKSAIVSALGSDQQTRALMRARSAKQRFPIAQWKEDLEILQASSIKAHAAREARLSRRYHPHDSAGQWSSVLSMSSRSSLWWMTPAGSRRASLSGSRNDGTPHNGRSGTNTPFTLRSSANSRMNSRSNSPIRSGILVPSSSDGDLFSLGTRCGPGNETSNTERDDAAHESQTQADAVAPVMPSISENEEAISRQDARDAQVKATDAAREAYDGLARHSHGSTNSSRSSSRRQTLLVDRDSKPLAITTVINEKETKQAEDLTPFFTDPHDFYYKKFETKLAGLDSKNSENSLCVEEYLTKSEKEWFHRLHLAKIRPHKPGQDSKESAAEFNLSEDYEAPRGLKRWMVYKIFDWPVYAIFLALGQILSANSYQITLLTGRVGETANQLYAIAGVYLVTSVLWWCIFRRFASVYVLTLPWFLFGLAFFFIGVAPWLPSSGARGRLQDAAILLYGSASSAGAFFYTQNFGSVGTVPVKDWAFRACAIQGTQQLYIVGLWAWGSSFSTATDYGWKLTAAGVPIAVFLWAVGAALYVGLPSYYRQKPGAIPDFYKAICRRKIMLWFLFGVFVQNLILSAPYGRNWAYLFSSKWTPAWALALLIILFFVVMWFIALWCFYHLSARHTWILPIFAIGLGAPRWCQILWSTSNIGTYLPWAGGPVASGLMGRVIWLWLGLLDTIQGVGIGMILLQTMARFHLNFALVAAQVIGSVGTIIARADNVNSLGPGHTFPSFAATFEGLSWAWFWIGLLSQLLICAGYFKFFRSEQLTRP